MFRKIKRVIASMVLVCSVFSLTALPSSSASAMWDPTWVSRMSPAQRVAYFRHLEFCHRIGYPVLPDSALVWFLSSNRGR